MQGLKSINYTYTVLLHYSTTFYCLFYLESSAIAFHASLLFYLSLFDLCPPPHPLPPLPFSLSVSFCVPLQDQRVATCSSTTSLRSLGMESWCRCSCLSVMSSPPKCLWIGRQTKVNALVGKNDQTKRLLVIYSDYSFCTNHFLYCSQLPPPQPPPFPS